MALRCRGRRGLLVLAAVVALRASALLLLCCAYYPAITAAAVGDNALRLGFYSSSSSSAGAGAGSRSCPRAEDIVREQVTQLYHKHGNTAVSWLRALFHDCMVRSCDASLLLDTAGGGGVSEKASPRSLGMRNFKYVDAIKAAVERECPGAVSCADILALAARDGAALLGGPRVAMRTGRRDARRSYYGEVERYIPDHNDTVSVVLSRFAAMGVDAEGAVALLGAHSVGRVHCANLVGRLYPSVDGGMDPAYGAYLRGRCPSPTTSSSDESGERAVEYARNDRVTPMVLDNAYYKNLVARRGLLLVDQRLADDPRTAPLVARMAADNAYFRDRFAAALLQMSENSPLTGDEGEIRKDCRLLN